MTDVKVVAPANMGERLVWDGQAKQYKVDVSDLIARLNNLETKPTFNPPKINNLNTDIQQLGYTPFWGAHSHGISQTDATGSDWTIGFPVTFDGAKVKGTETFEEVRADPHWNIDYTGWQLATSVEVVQTVYHYGISWTRTNDRGMNPDGTLKNPNTWSDWTRSPSA